MSRSLPNDRRFGNPTDVNFYSLSAGGRHAAAATRRILQICDSSEDVPGEIEALLRDEFAKVARHA
jgi:hypothetical protein